MRALLPGEVQGALDWSTVARAPGSFIDPQLADRHSDLLFRVELAGQPAYLYLLLEHQSRVDPDMPLRMLVYLVRIWERHRKQHPWPARLPLIVPAVVSHARGGWTGAVEFGALFEPRPEELAGLEVYIPRFELLLDDLSEVDDGQLRARALSEFPLLALWALRDARDGAKLLAGLATWAEVGRKLLLAGDGATAMMQLLRYIAQVGGDVQFEEFRGRIRAQLPEAESIAMTIAEQLRQEGRAEGRVEGRVEGRAATLIELLTLEFGPLGPGQVARVQGADEAQLRAWLARVLAADSVEAVLGQG